MDINSLKTVYFLGIGGIGMSALARYLNSRGVTVSGYDKTETPLTRELVREGIAVHYQPDVLAVTDQTDLVVFTPAVPDDFAEWASIRQKNIPVMKRSAMLAHVVNNLKSIAVAGTHGKTTTSAMIAHAFADMHQPFLGFVGGVLGRYNTNIFIDPKAEWAVAEADEYDRSFLALHPHIAIINAIDADHLDIYGKVEALCDSFSQFAAQTHPDGKVLVFDGIDHSKLTLPANTVWYGFENSTGYAARNIRIESGCYVFDMFLNNALLIDNIVLPAAGRHNVQNASAAFAALHLAGNDAEAIRAAMGCYPGVKRRLELIAENKNVVYFDDYAHHPAEIKALIETIRALYPDKTITGIFQPHLFSRTRDFGVEFAQVLSTLDVPVITDIYPAREKPMEGIDAQWLLSQMTNPAKKYLSYANIPDIVNDELQGVLLTIGAGDIDVHVETIKNRIAQS